MIVSPEEFSETVRNYEQNLVVDSKILSKWVVSNWEDGVMISCVTQEGLFPPEHYPSHVRKVCFKKRKRYRVLDDADSSNEHQRVSVANTGVSDRVVILRKAFDQLKPLRGETFLTDDEDENMQTSSGSTAYGQLPRQSAYSFDIVKGVGFIPPCVDRGDDETQDNRIMLVMLSVCDVRCVADAVAEVDLEYKSDVHTVQFRFTSRDTMLLFVDAVEAYVNLKLALGGSSLNLRKAAAGVTLAEVMDAYWNIHSAIGLGLSTHVVLVSGLHNLPSALVVNKARLIDDDESPRDDDNGLAVEVHMWNLMAVESTKPFKVQALRFADDNVEDSTDSGEWRLLAEDAVVGRSLPSGERTLESESPGHLVGTALWMYLVLQVPEAVRQINNSVASLQGGFGRDTDTVLGVMILLPYRQCVVEQSAAAAFAVSGKDDNVGSDDGDCDLLFDLTAVADVYRLADGWLLLRQSAPGSTCVLFKMQDRDLLSAVYEVALTIAEFNSNQDGEVDPRVLFTKKKQTVMAYGNVPFVMSKLTDTKLKIQVNVKNARGQRKRPIKFNFASNEQMQNFEYLGNFILTLCTGPDKDSTKPDSLSDIKADVIEAVTELKGKRLKLRGGGFLRWTNAVIDIDNLLLVPDDERHCEYAGTDHADADDEESDDGAFLRKPGQRKKTVQFAVDIDYKRASSAADGSRDSSKWSALRRKSRMVTRAMMETGSPSPSAASYVDTQKSLLVGIKKMLDELPYNSVVHLATVTSATRIGDIVTLGFEDYSTVEVIFDEIQAFTELCHSCAEHRTLDKSTPSFRISKENNDDGVLAVHLDSHDTPLIFQFRTEQKRHNFSRLCVFLQQQTEEWRTQQLITQAGVLTTPSADVLYDLRTDLRRACPEARYYVYNKEVHVWCGTASAEHSMGGDKRVACEIDTLTAKIRIRNKEFDLLEQFIVLSDFDDISGTITLWGVSKLERRTSSTPHSILIRLAFLDIPQYLFFESSDTNLMLAFIDVVNNTISHNYSTHFALLHMHEMSMRKELVELQSILEAGECWLHTEDVNDTNRFRVPLRRGLCLDDVEDNTTDDNCFNLLLRLTSTRFLQNQASALFGKDVWALFDGVERAIKMKSHGDVLLSCETDDDSDPLIVLSFFPHYNARFFMMWKRIRSHGRKNSQQSGGSSLSRSYLSTRSYSMRSVTNDDEDMLRQQHTFIECRCPESVELTHAVPVNVRSLKAERPDTVPAMFYSECVQLLILDEFTVANFTVMKTLNASKRTIAMCDVSSVKRSSDRKLILRMAVDAHWPLEIEFAKVDEQRAARLVLQAAIAFNIATKFVLSEVACTTAAEAKLCEVLNFIKANCNSSFNAMSGVRVNVRCEADPESTVVEGTVNALPVRCNLSIQRHSPLADLTPDSIDLTRTESVWPLTSTSTELTLHRQRVTPYIFDIQNGDLSQAFFTLCSALRDYSKTVGFYANLPIGGFDLSHGYPQPLQCLAPADRWLRKLCSPESLEILKEPVTVLLLARSKKMLETVMERSLSGSSLSSDRGFYKLTSQQLDEEEFTFSTPSKLLLRHSNDGRSLVSPGKVNPMLGNKRSQETSTTPRDSTSSTIQITLGDDGDVVHLPLSQLQYYHMTLDGASVVAPHAPSGQQMEGHHDFESASVTCLFTSVKGLIRLTIADANVWCALREVMRLTFQYNLHAWEYERRTNVKTRKDAGGPAPDSDRIDSVFNSGH